MGENWYERHILPYLLDAACGIGPVRQQRALLVPQARGRVLEIGIGTGRNLAHYDPSRISSIVGLDPGVQMHRLARRRLARTPLKLDLVGLSAEKIPYEDGRFDTVLVTYSLCSIPDPVVALAEMRRVLKPGGKLLFSEHGLAPDADVRRWQERITPYWRKLAGGCHLNRDVPALLAAAGFECCELHCGYLTRPHSLSYNYRGVAQGA